MLIRRLVKSVHATASSRQRLNAYLLHFLIIKVTIYRLGIIAPGGKQGEIPTNPPSSSPAPSPILELKTASLCSGWLNLYHAHHGALSADLNERGGEGEMGNIGVHADCMFSSGAMSVLRLPIAKNSLQRFMPCQKTLKMPLFI